MPRPHHLLFLVLPLLLACEVQESRRLAPGAVCDPEGPMRCDGPSASCLPLDGGAGVCTHACMADSQCPPDLTCRVEPGGSIGRCAPGFRCDTNSDCPSGHRCDPDAGSCYVWVKRDLCAPCTADIQCPAGGTCFTAIATGERFCTVDCANCPRGEGYECRTLEDGSSQCLPVAGTCEGQRPLCSPCTGDVQCGDGNDLCVTNFLSPSGERFCGVSCNPACNDGSCTSVCPENFRCADLSGEGDGPFQCVPNAGTCAGWCDGAASCPPGYDCNAEHACVPAVDGRACAPCVDDDGCCRDGRYCATESRCVANPTAGESFCAPLCEDDLHCIQAAGPGFACQSVGGARLCLPTGGSCSGGASPLGASCSAATACLSGVCLMDGASGLCSARCDEDAACGDSSYRCCAVVPGAEAPRWDCDLEPGELGGVCAPRGGVFGDSCEPGMPPCHDGHCLDLHTARLCTAGCETHADCDKLSGEPGAFTCASAKREGTGEGIRICFPAGGGSIGSDCTFGPAACSARFCIVKESGNVCTHECRDGSECPTGWSCGPTKTVDGEEERLCLPPTVAG